MGIYAKNCSISLKIQKIKIFSKILLKKSILSIWINPGFFQMD